MILVNMAYNSITQVWLIDISHKSHNDLSHIPQYTIQNRNVHISVLNDASWDMGQVHCGICEIWSMGLLAEVCSNPQLMLESCS